MKGGEIMAGKNKRGRKNQYFTHVKPRFDEIAEWLKLGATDKEIIENLGIGKSAFYCYLNDYPDFSEFLKENRKSPVQEIKAAMFKNAVGFDYSEKQTIYEADENGCLNVVRVVKHTKHSKPDPASGMILLKQWAKDEGWTNDPAALKLRREELEFKKQQAERDDW